MRSAFTLIEMLVSLVITMIMMFAVVTLFQVMTDSVSGSRALMEASDRLRACRNRLQADLLGATATMAPPLRPENNEGYFELGEGVTFDGNNGKVGNGASLYGDTDDYLAFTTRSRNEAFVGFLASTGTATSQTAEVIYFLGQSGTEPILDANQSPPTRLYTLYRRVLLVISPGPMITNADDISQRSGISGQIPNTLGDLTKPENRFNHNASGTFPFQMALPLAGFVGPRLGDDIILTNVLAFDAQVFDPGAPVFVTTAAPQLAVEPRDQGYRNLLVAWIKNGYPYPNASAPSSFGAFADLGYGFNILATPPTPPPVTYYNPPTGPPSTLPIPLFSGAADAKSGWVALSPQFYDTWSLHYENDGVQQRSTWGTDTGTNGLDDNSNGIVDDAVYKIPPVTGTDTGEADTLPPYSAKLRGVRITVRVYEPSSQQVREISVVQEFLPE